MDRALQLLREWPEGMPPLPSIDAGIGTLVSLEREGLARRLNRDSFGDLRFTLTPEGLAKAAEAAP